MERTTQWARALRGMGVGLAVLAISALPALAQEKVSVRLDFSPWGVHAAMHLAKEKGWFKEAGLDVDVQDGRGSGNTLQLVNAGQVDVGQIQLGLLPQARENGAQVKGIAGWGRRTDLAVLVDKDSPIKKVSDFAGKTLVVFAASPWAPYIDYWLKQGGLDRTKTTIMFVDPAALWGTYTAKRADGLMSTEPSALPIAAAARPSKAILAEDAGVAYPSYGLVATEKTIAAKREALAKLVAVQAKAWAYLRDGKIEEGVDAIVKQRPDAKLDRTALAEQIRLTIAFFDTPATQGKPIGWQADSDWNAALKGLEAAGAVKPGWKTSDYYTNDLIK
ncbi:ABC transporter substrate-binding protein [Methylobacterium nodulans]|uniref:NMT1/THI5 like domain protein n=1 Tax=Methylobacterium nodulans (strain LMG 21967 / CNCM I-2342 / ORS 2060) TaxID=460265 RepID=B8IME7_METNO|nr:ABC transporter substrate-binding protein [Methylobacterium nodulans]ACL58333.1 NMT1/THI5 like domain protein [Methylobacterium nodulans ORS 2060]